MAEPAPKPYWFPDMTGFISILLIVAVVALLFILAFRNPDGDMFKYMVGAVMGSGFTGIINFYLGSSQGSKDKDAAMAKIAGGAPESPPATVPTIASTASVAPAAPTKPLPPGVAGPNV